MSPKSQWAIGCAVALWTTLVWLAAGRGGQELVNALTRLIN